LLEDGVLFRVEFIRITDDAPDGVIVRINCGHFANERDAEACGALECPEGADAFRIVLDGIVKKTVIVRSRYSG
jgi:hypothetical protein